MRHAAQAGLKRAARAVDSSAVDAWALTTLGSAAVGARPTATLLCVAMLWWLPVQAAGSVHGANLSDQSVAASSAAAVHGVVAAVTPLDEPGVGGIYTVVSIAVRRSWGLPGAPASIDLKLLGGVAGRRALVVDGQATFVIGEEVFAFLDVRPRDGTLAVTALGRGKWTIAPPATAGDGAVSGRPAFRDHDPVPRTVETLHALAALAATAVQVPPSLRMRVPRPTVASMEHVADAQAATASAGRWHHADRAANVPVDASGIATTSPIVAPLMRAVQAWSAASALTLEPGALRGPRCFVDATAGDGRIAVTFGDPCDEIADTSPVLAFGAAFFDANDLRVVGGVPYAGITSGVVVVDNAPGKLDALGGACLEELVTHELGHAIGLAHASDPASVMYPALSPTCGQRTTATAFSESDRTALRARYPHAPAQSGPPSSPVGLMAAVHGDAVRLRWSAAPGPGATSFHLSAGSAPGESDLGVLTVGASGVDLAPVPRGVYYLRIAARNAAGLSAPSAEITVSVGANLPPAPVGLMAAAEGTGRVRLFWQAPSGTGPAATSYVLLVRMPDTGRLLRVPVASTAFVADGVPSGAYPVRVAAVTGAGVGPASAEILLLVP